MSIQANEKKQRMDQNPGGEASRGVVQGAPFEDPSGLYPRRSYYNSTSVNKAATGGQRNELSTPATADGVNIDFPVSSGSQYPYNQVSESVSGHIWEVDDTPGGERMLIMHKDGHGIELRTDGSVIISSNNHKVEMVGGDNTVIVEGEANLVYKGNLNLKVTGDFKLDVAGDYSVNVAGNKSENVTGSHRTTVNGNMGQIISGGFSTTVTQQVTDTFLAGHSHNVKGTFSNNVDGDANYVASGSSTMTAEGTANISSPNINIAADNLSAFGGTGVIGGQEVFVYGYNGEFQKSVYAETMSADTFHGDLTGTAAGAQVAGGLGSPGSLTNTALDITVKAIPTASIVRTYLSKAAGGVRKVKIDIGDFIKNMVDKTSSYGGVSSSQVNAGKARSRMRDPANRSNSAFVGQLIADQAICPQYNTPTPKGIGRIISGDNVTEQGSTPIGNSVSTTQAYIPAPASVTLVPDFQYNPFFAGPITASTKLAPGISIAKFLGTDDPTNLNFIKNAAQRTQLAKYYYLHAQIIKTVQEDKNKFKNFNLLVSEGLYRPGPEEKITADSINDLKLKGRAVVYKLVDNTGKSNPTNLFDLAAYLKSKIYYDKMILSYDTIDRNCTLDARLIIILPEVSDTWVGTYSRIVETEFNGNKLAQGELVEVLPIPSAGSSNTSTYDFSGVNVESYSGKITGAISKLNPKLLELLDKAASTTGIQPSVSSGYRSPGANPSGRHAGFAADLSLAVDGRLLSVGNSRDRALIEEFVKAFLTAGRSQGIQPCVGVANHMYPKTRWYMGGNYFHLDIYGNPPHSPAMSAGQSRFWGGSGGTADVPAPQWLRALF